MASINCILRLKSCTQVRCGLYIQSNPLHSRFGHLQTFRSTCVLLLLAWFYHQTNNLKYFNSYYFYYFLYSCHNTIIVFFYFKQTKYQTILFFSLKVVKHFGLFVFGLTLFVKEIIISLRIAPFDNNKQQSTKR